MADTTYIEQQQRIPELVLDELAHYEEQIKKYRAGELGEVKMQKLRLHFGTYAQRQEGVQMQRIKFPGGILTSDQLIRLADTADRYGNLSFRHAQMNFGPVMATAANITVAEVRAMLDEPMPPERVQLPGVYVDRVVEMTP